MTRDVAASPRRGRRYRSLRGTPRFSAIRKAGRRVRRGGLVVMVAPGSPGLPEVGIVAGRRVGNAVQRNRAKRRLRAACDTAPLRSDTAYVLIASPEVADAPFPQVVEWLQTALQATERGTE